MRTIRVFEHISLDGVVQSPGSREEDGKDFPYGGWMAPYSSETAGQAVMELHANSFDLILGRHTYDNWSNYWPTASNALAGGLNAATKYIATHRPDSLAWGPVQDLGADIVAGVRNVKSTEGPDLILWGSSTLASVLLTEGLVDEVVFFVYPVLLGQGKRFFPEGTAPSELALVSSKVTETGVLINTYRYVQQLQA